MSSYKPQLEQDNAVNGVLGDAGKGASMGGSVAGPYGAVIGGVIGAGAGFIGANAAADANARAAAAQRAALEKLAAIQAPELAVNFEKYGSAGTLNPTLQQNFQQGNTGLSDINVDPSLMGAAKDSLGSLQYIGHNGGLTLQDQANMNKLLGQQQQSNAGAQKAIMQNMAQRGMGGSGFELAQSMMAQQAGANTANQQGTDIAAQAQARALQALSSAGTLGAGLNNQMYGQQANAASAQDSINKFNTQNQQAVSGANANTQNTAQQYNLNNAQRIADANTNLGNQQQLQNNAYQQQNFDDQLKQSGAYADQSNAVAKGGRADGQSAANAIGAIGQGIGQVGSAIDDYSNTSKPATDPNQGLQNANSPGANVFGAQQTYQDKQDALNKYDSGYNQA